MPLARRPAFWLGLGIVLVAAGAAVLGWAYVENQAPPIVAYETEAGAILDGCSIFGCVDRFDPTAWYAGGGALIAAATAPFALAARR
jgi:hypothetical protein